ncbi:MAG: hypothetical protein KKE73_08265 [Proteobacteria bacterium]|nr:hypothetical protein [Pseudomonadota bacterium]
MACADTPVKIQELEERFGRRIELTTLARYLGVAPNTVRKYASRLGGIEVTPGTWRFFDKRVERFIHGKYLQETRGYARAGGGHGPGQDPQEMVPGRFQNVHAGGHPLGGAGPKGAAGDDPDRSAGDNRHGLLG